MVWGHSSSLDCINLSKLPVKFRIHLKILLITYKTLLWQASSQPPWPPYQSLLMVILKPEATRLVTLVVTPKFWKCLVFRLTIDCCSSTVDIKSSADCLLYVICSTMVLKERFLITLCTVPLHMLGMRIKPRDLTWLESVYGAMNVRHHVCNFRHVASSIMYSFFPQSLKYFSNSLPL